MIRRASVVDLVDVVGLEERCLGDDAWSQALIEQGLAGLPTVTYVVAERDGVVVGHAVVSVAGDIAELQRIAVDHKSRRRGVAGALLAEIVTIAQAGQADRMLLEVRDDNAAALGFYAALGFVEIDRRSRYYRDGVTAIVLRRALGPACGGRS